MSKSFLCADKIAKVFRDYCDSKNYQVKKSKEANNLRLEISNLSDRTIVNVYNTRKVVVQGKQSSLKKEIETLKRDFEANPESFRGDGIAEIKPCATRYDIMLPLLRTEIKE